MSVGVWAGREGGAGHVQGCAGACCAPLRARAFVKAGLQLADELETCSSECDADMSDCNSDGWLSLCESELEDLELEVAELEVGMAAQIDSADEGQEQMHVRVRQSVDIGIGLQSSCRCVRYEATQK